MILKKELDPRAYMPSTRGSIHVYYHNIQTSSPLKPIGHLKSQILCEASIGWRNQCILLGHMTKMATMPIYGKNPSKIFFSETNRLISMKLGVKH